MNKEERKKRKKKENTKTIAYVPKTNEKVYKRNVIKIRPCKHIKYKTVHGYYILLGMRSVKVYGGYGGGGMGVWDQK